MGCVRRWVALGTSCREPETTHEVFLYVASQQQKNSHNIKNISFHAREPTVVRWLQQCLTDESTNITKPSLFSRR